MHQLTAMIVHGIPGGAAIDWSSKVRRGIDQLTRRLTTGKEVARPSDNTNAWREAELHRARVRDLDAIHGQLTELGTGLRSVRQGTQAIGQLLASMKVELEALRANPPAAEQQQHVAQFNELRKQIDDLANNNPNGIARQLTGDPARVAGPGNIEAQLNDSGALYRIGAQPLHMGAGGLDIHELGPGISDAALTAAEANLEQAQSRFQERSQKLESAEAAIAGAMEPNEKLSAVYRNRVDTLTAADLNETAMELKALELQQQLLTGSYQIVHTLQLEVTQLLA